MYSLEIIVEMPSLEGHLESEINIFHQTPYMNEGKCISRLLKPRYQVQMCNR